MRHAPKKARNVKAKAKPAWTFHTWMRSALRRAWGRSPMRGDFLKAVRFRANIGRGGQEIWAGKCAMCKGTFPQGKLQVDHIIPVGPAPGSKNAPPDLTWDSFIDRMFKPASPEFYQLLCKSCHTKKSSEEKSKLAATVRERKGNKDVPAVPRKRARRKPPAPSRVRRTKRSRR